MRVIYQYNSRSRDMIQVLNKTTLFCVFYNYVQLCQHCAWCRPFPKSALSTDWIFV